jgi:hypothetical protein
MRPTRLVDPHVDARASTGEMQVCRHGRRFAGERGRVVSTASTIVLSLERE